MTGDKAYMEAWAKEGPSSLRNTHADGEYFDPSAALRKRVELMRSGDYDLPAHVDLRSGRNNDDHFIAPVSARQKRTQDGDARVESRILPFDCL